MDSRIEMPDGLGFQHPRVFLPGILVVEGPRYEADVDGPRPGRGAVLRGVQPAGRDQRLPAGGRGGRQRSAARTLDNFLWTTFTRSNPAADIYGIESFVADKHWGCFGSLVIDARIKPHHAPPLVEDPEVTRRVDALAAAGGPLHGII